MTSSPTCISDFEKIQILGKGSFGNVYKVKRKKDGKIYALKTVFIEKLNEKEQQNSLNEVKILASVNHPNVIGYKESFWDNKTNTLNIVMEYASDGDLQTLINSQRKSRNYFSEKTIWSYAIQMICGLKSLHDAKIMHRDLKSANIFLDNKKAICKIGDMNVSKYSPDNLLYTQTGTPYYASPEVWNDQSYTNKSDMWSIGCVIYELCSFKPPFKGKDLDELYVNVCGGKVNRISQNYSNDLWEAIMMLLETDPEKRLSCDQFLGSNLIKKKIKELGLGKFLDNNRKKYRKKIDNEQLFESTKFNSVSDIKNILPKFNNYDVNNNNIIINSNNIKSNNTNNINKNNNMNNISIKQLNPIINKKNSLTNIVNENLNNNYINNKHNKVNLNNLKKNNIIKPEFSPNNNNNIKKIILINNEYINLDRNSLKKNPKNNNNRLLKMNTETNNLNNNFISVRQKALNTNPNYSQNYAEIRNSVTNNSHINLNNISHNNYYSNNFINDSDYKHITNNSVRESNSVINSIRSLSKQNTNINDYKNKIISDNNSSNNNVNYKISSEISDKIMNQKELIRQINNIENKLKRHISDNILNYGRHSNSSNHSLNSKNINNNINNIIKTTNNTTSNNNILTDNNINNKKKQFKKINKYLVKRAEINIANENNPQFENRHKDIGLKNDNIDSNLRKKYMYKQSNSINTTHNSSYSNPIGKLNLLNPSNIYMKPKKYMKKMNSCHTDRQFTSSVVNNINIIIETGKNDHYNNYKNINSNTNNDYMIKKPILSSNNVNDRRSLSTQPMEQQKYVKPIVRKKIKNDYDI